MRYDMRYKLIGVLIACSWVSAVHAQVNALPQARHILVYGDAHARAIPDRFKIDITFSVVDQKADVARAKVEADLQDTISKLKAASVKQDDIVATSLAIEPQNEYDQDQRKQVFKGIEVTRKVTARFGRQEDLKRFLSGLETSKELQVSGVGTELSQEPLLRKQLRQKAIESTREKAEVIAKAYGVRLAGLYSVSDTAPQFEYGITQGEWPAMYQWQRDSSTLDRVEVTGARARVASAPAASLSAESFSTGYVNFDDKIYAVFLISE